MAIIASPTVTIEFLAHGAEARAAPGLFVDWQDDDAFTQVIDNITPYFRSGGWNRGRTSELSNTPGGTFSFEVNDLDGDFSPENTSSRFGSGNVDIGKKVRLAFELDGVTYEAWRGRINEIAPHSRFDEAFASFYCVDGTQGLAVTDINAPLDSGTNHAETPLVDTRSGDQGVTLVTGVDITFNDANPDTIVRAAGSFVTDGYLVGQQIKVKGSLLNDGIYTVDTVVALTLTLASTVTLTAAGAASGITVEVIGIIPEILDQFGWPVADRTIDPGVDVFDLWWLKHTKALTGIYDTEDAERSKFYIDEEGKATWEDRHHKLRGSSNPHRTSQATFNETMDDMVYIKSSRNLINRITVRGHKRTQKASEQVYGTQDRPRIGAGETVVLWADLSEPTTQISIDTTGDGTDWKANSKADGTGTDLTSNLTLVANPYGQSVELIINNGGSQTAFLVPGTSDPDDTLYMTGLPFDDDVIVVIDSDSASETKRDPSGHSIEMAYKGDANNLRAFAGWFISRFKDPQPDFIRMPVTGHTNALLKNLLSLKVSDRITCTYARLGISAQDYFIAGLEMDFEPGGVLSGVYLLEKVDAEESTSWVLGVATLSELGQTTVVGF